MSAFTGIVIGIVLLIVGGTMLVRGACEVAARLGVSPLIVGLTIVAFGTSAPELFVNIASATSGATALAFGNVVGSNITNLCLVLGLAAIVAPITVQGEIVRRELPLLMVATAILTVMALDLPLDNAATFIGRPDAGVLLLLFSLFLYATIVQVLRTRRTDALLTDIKQHPVIAAPQVDRLRWPLVLGGFALLFVGGEVAIRSSVDFAEHVGISSTVVGLFVVAIGTSMPELITSVVAAFHNESDLAVGNVVGSNFFNSLMVLPVSALITQIEIPELGIGDLAFSLLLTAILIPLLYIGGPRLGRLTGVVLVAVYAGYATVRLSYAGA